MGSIPIPATMELNGNYMKLWAKYPRKDWLFGHEGQVVKHLAIDTGFTNKGKTIFAVKKNQWTSTSGHSGES